MRSHILFLVLLIIGNSIYSQISKLQEYKLCPQKKSESIELLKLNSSEHPLLKKVFYSFANHNWAEFSEKVYEYNIDNNLSKTVENRISPRYDEFTLFFSEDYSYYELNPSLLREKISVQFFDWDPTQYSRVLLVTARS